MKMLFRYMKPYSSMIFVTMTLKLLGTMCELTLPYILEHIVDDVVPTRQALQAVFWGLLMFLAAIACRQLNSKANSRAVHNSHRVSYDIRQDLFHKTSNLSGSQFDAFGLPSLISRMTSDSYNVQSAVQSIQVMCVRIPIMMLGGVCMTLLMDRSLAMILVTMLPILIVLVIVISAKGIPLYNRVQERLDDVVRILRENITGIRVVKALSKTDYEKRRFAAANQAMASSDILAGSVMAMPAPVMQLFLNTGLTLIVLFGASRVNAGLMKPGVILAFLTYFNMISQGVMGLNRIFMMLSKASASADRIERVLQTETDQKILTIEEAKKPAGEEFIRFEQVSFSYGGAGEAPAAAETPDPSAFGTGKRQKALEGIDFAVKKGESLGIIGPTGCGKTTIINLLMRFYDADEGGVFVGGRDVRTYEKDELHRLFGAAFQNDIVFQDTLRENINFGRNLTDAQIRKAVECAMAAEYIDGLEDGLMHQAAIKGANLSGGQKQRLLVARALAGEPQILVLDDSSSALDYRTDASMRKEIAAHYPETTLIMIAQRVSSVMNMTNILVLDDGRCIGYGNHTWLLAHCPEYKEIYDTQMGAMIG